MAGIGLGVLLSLLPSGGRGVERIALSLAQLSGAGIELEELELTLTAGEGAPAVLTGRVGRLFLPALGERMEALALHCPTLIRDGDGLHCPDGELRARHRWLDPGTARLALDWRPGDGHWRVRLGGVRLAGGQWRLQLEGAGSDGRFEVRAQGVDAARLIDLGMVPEWDPAQWAIQGRAALTLKGRWDARGLVDARWQVQWRDGGFSDASGDTAGEGLAVRVSGSAKRDRAGGLGGDLAVTLTAGALLTPRAYLEIADRPLELALEYGLDPALRKLHLAALHYRHPGVLTFQAEGRVALEPLALESLHLETGDTALDPLYRACFQPVLSGTLLERVAWRGNARMVIAQSPGGDPLVKLVLQGVGLEDLPDPHLQPREPPRFALHGLDGHLAWSPDPAQPRPVELTWGGGRLLQALVLGPATLQGELRGRSFRITRPLELPLLDGQLMVDDLALGSSPGGEPQLDFDAILTPVSMQRLSDAFGWPPLAGSLSGVIPGLSLRAGGVRVEGNLLVRVFDGDIVISGLHLDHLFSPLPVLRADVQVRNLDLETLTRTFSFGRITGRLDGGINGLRLEGWRPISFDARLATAEDDDSPHYVNQRAVENISNLGGAGIGGSLSRGFLSLFKEFHYEKLGISCKLAHGVCAMGGVAPAENGYYLVVGSGIPQINVKGFTTRTDWSRLVQQLQQISESGAPVVE